MCNKYIHAVLLYYDFVDPKVNLILIANEKCIYEAVLLYRWETYEHTQGEAANNGDSIVGVWAAYTKFLLYMEKVLSDTFRFYMRQISIGHVLNYGREIVWACVYGATLEPHGSMGLHAERLIRKMYYSLDGVFVLFIM